MSNTFSFYSVSSDVADTLRSAFASSIEADNIVRGKTPLGEVELQYDYSAASGQLTIVVLKKPYFVSMGMIQDHLRDALNSCAAHLAANAVEAKPVPVPPTEAPPAPSSAPEPIPAKTEEAQTVVAAPPE